MLPVFCMCVYMHRLCLYACGIQCVCAVLCVGTSRCNVGAGMCVEVFMVGCVMKFVYACCWRRKGGGQSPISTQYRPLLVWLIMYSPIKTQHMDETNIAGTVVHATKKDANIEGNDIQDAEDHHNRLISSLHKNVKDLLEDPYLNDWCDKQWY